MDLLPEHVQKISNLAANYVRDRAPRKTGNAKSFIYPSRSQYTPGVVIREGGKYLLFQNDGMEPRDMVELEGKTIPMTDKETGETIFRKVKDVGKQVAVRDSLGRYNGSKIKWRHPGFKASHVIEQSIDDAIRAVVADIPQDELIEYVRKANATYGK